MKIIIVENENELGEKAYAEIKNVLTTNPSPTLGLATGTTPIPLYKEMVADYQKGNISYKNVKTFNLDEYIGLPKEHPESYISFMTRNLFSQIDIDMKNVNIPNGLAKDIDAECKRYSELLENAVIDIQVLGIGTNGHIAFNKPGTPFDSKTHKNLLTKRTIKDNSRFFDSIEEVPKSALTMGIEEIFRAKKILMLATGKNKADAVYKMIKGEVTPEVPASILQKHPSAIVIIDKDAASKL